MQSDAADGTAVFINQQREHMNNTKRTKRYWGEFNKSMGHSIQRERESVCVCVCVCVCVSTDTDTDTDTNTHKHTDTQTHTQTWARLLQERPTLNVLNALLCVAACAGFGVMS